MKAAFLSELMSLRSLLAQVFVIDVMIGAIIGVGMQSAVGLVASVAAMGPVTLVFTQAAWDGMNGWERYRAALPVSRTAIVQGRYLNALLASVASLVLALGLAYVLAGAFTLVGAESEMAQNYLAEMGDPMSLVAAGSLGTCAMLLFVSALLPFMLLYGMNKAMRIVPVVMMALVFGLIAVVPDMGSIGFVADLRAFIEAPENTWIVLGASCAVVLAVCAASCAVAAVLYRRKDL